jgi:methionyl-tRNA formyltransferase
VTKNGIDVACKDSVLRITAAQRAGGKRLPVAQFLDGFHLEVGAQLL